MTALGAALGLVLDRALGEPRFEPHPVALLGRGLAALEARTYRDDRRVGVVHALAGAGIGVAAGLVARSTALATYVSSSGRMLGEAAAAVHGALDRGDLDAARSLLPSLVGRDPSSLDGDEIARAVVESVAENTVDAVVAPALWGAVAGAPGALGHRAVNTLDSMVGHRSARYERFGWASARLDDAMAFVPARVTAALVALARPARAVDVGRVVRRDASGHPSPNAGVAEAAFAAALELRLGGLNRYGDRTEHRAELGDGKPPTPADIPAPSRCPATSRSSSLVPSEPSVLPEPGEHGGDAAAVARALGLDPASVLDLSVSLNPVAPEVRPLLASHLDSVTAYPDAACAEAALAERLGSEVLLTNGGSEAIALVAASLGAVSVREPEFSLWRRHARIVEDGPLVRSNPNNPLGTLAGDDERAAVWDEAFFPLATGSWTRGDADTIVVGSLTKLFACPGLRIGFVAGGDLDEMRRLQPAWSVSSLACAALPAMLDRIDLPATARRIASLRADLVDVLHAAGLPVRPSGAPWVLVDAPLRSRLAPHGIVVRDCASFDMPGVTRIAVPGAHGLERLERALRA